MPKVRPPPQVAEHAELDVTSIARIPAMKRREAAREDLARIVEIWRRWERDRIG